MTSRPRLILVCGLPGSGKTTRARRLAGEVGAVRLSGDEWMAALEIDMHDERMRDRLEVQFWKFARELLELDQNVILESGFWLRSDRDEKRTWVKAHGGAIELHYLNVPFEERLARIERRNVVGTLGTVPITREQLARWEQFFEPPYDDELALFDKVFIDRPERLA